MKSLIVITARKGSKGIPCKNFRKIYGKSLTEYAVDFAVEAKREGIVDEVCLSTDSDYLMQQFSDYPEITNIGLRSSQTSKDTTKSVDVVEEVLDILEHRGKNFKYVIVIQPTTPYRNIEDLKNALEIIKSKQGKSLVSVCCLKGINVNGLYFKQQDELTPLLPNNHLGIRRQESQSVYVRNGALYITDVEYIRNNHGLISKFPLCLAMDEKFHIDIDDYSDLKRAKLLLKTAAKVSGIFVIRSNQLNKLREITQQQAIRIIDINKLLDGIVGLCYGQKMKLKDETERIIEQLRVSCYFDGDALLCMGDKLEFVASLKEREIMSETIINDKRLRKYVSLMIDDLCDTNICVVDDWGIYETRKHVKRFDSYI